MLPELWTKGTLGFPQPKEDLDEKETLHKGLGGTGLGSGSDEGTAGKKVVSPRARRQMARAACARGLRTGRAAGLCSTPRSVLGYTSRKIQRDAQLAQALHGVGKRYPHWRYRVAGSFLQGRGWLVNLKRIYRVWQQQGLGLQNRKWRRKIRTGETVRP